VDAPCEPKPIQQPLPLLLGVSGERVGMRIAAAHADEWSCWGLPTEIATKMEALDRHCRDVGRDPATLQRSARALLLMSDDAGQLAEWRSEDVTAPRMIGTPPEIAEIVARYAAIGLDELVISDRTLGEGPAERRATMDRFQRDVADRFRPPVS